ncbi:MAG: hypothetical protein JWR40_2676 [Massilia sp.]|nr:hypothetical protein [Massilia sp.]
MVAASEARAEKSTDYLAAILNAASTPIRVLDSARKIVMLNEAFCRFVGRGAAELVGQQESDVFDPANAGKRGLRYEKVLDGGVGAEATAYLKRFPVQRLKIDRAFIRDLGNDDDSAAIVRSILNLASGLNLDVVAEGVETEAQLALLRSMTCDEYQGYLFSRPVEAGAVQALFEANRTAFA